MAKSKFYTIYELKKGNWNQLDSTNSKSEATKRARIYSAESKNTNWMVKEEQDVAIFYDGKKVKQ